MTDARCLREVSISQGYSTSTEDLLTQFYIPLVTHSRSYDRAAGYFSSALLAIAPLAFADFAKQGGKFRVICSPYVSSIDQRTLEVSETLDSGVDEAVAALQDLAASSRQAEALLRAASSLIAAGVLEIKFAVHGSGGLFHDKVGIFRDSCGDTVSFVGSANETPAAWSGGANHEQIESFASWLSVEQADRARRHARYFEELWLDLARGVRVVRARAAEAILREHYPPTPLEDAFVRVREAWAEGTRTPRPTSSRRLRQHQIDVLTNWEAAGHRGVVEFATGGGKTLTALEAVRRWTTDGRPAVIFVPSTLLHRQWAREVRAELPDATLLRVGAGAPRAAWERALTPATVPNGSGQSRRVVLSTYQTGATEGFLRRVHAGPHLLVVADEVHRVGAPDTRSVLTLQAGGRLGLSATPERFGDPEGTEAIRAYFGEGLEPHFGIRDAIEARQLVPYDYYLHTVALTDDEMAQWSRLSFEIARAIAAADGDVTDGALALLRRRARIVKRASAKVDIAAQVLADNFRRGDRWLVYCESISHLKSVRGAVERMRMPVLEYHSENADVSEEVLAHFARGGVLLAVKCLDEGIDLPYVNRALILASSVNPREYIQRRGRVLRRAPEKTFAEVHDVVVLDPDGVLLSKSEARRALEFAEDAANKSGLVRLEQLLLTAGTSPYEDVVFEDEWGTDE